MSEIGLVKIFDEAIINTSKRSSLTKAVEMSSGKGIELESKGISKKTGDVEAKTTEKFADETLRLSKEALSQGKLSKAVKINFVENTVKTSEKIGVTLEKRNPVAAINEANSRYVEKAPELVELKYKFMEESPFAFYRSTGYIFYSDIAAEKSLASKVKIPVQGDLHLENIGTYKTTSDKIAYGLNDFDDAFVGAYTWDLARMATSIRLTAKAEGISEKEGEKLVEDYVKDYLKNLEKLQEKTGKLDNPLTENKHFDKHIEKTIEKASGTSQKDFINEMVSGGKFKISEKVRPISDEIKTEIQNAIKSYAKNRPESADFFRIKDSAFLISGKGSLGRDRYIVLLEGKGKDNRVILELKEAVQPSASATIGILPGNQAERVINANKYFSPSPDKYLGATKIKGGDFFVRELTPAGQRVDLAKLNTKGELKEHLETVSLVTARAHAVSGQGQKILDDAGSKSSLAERIGDFASKYLKRVEKDFKEFVNRKSVVSE